MLQRATTTWEDGATYYFLSPDGELWLEVTQESYHRALDNEDDVVAQLRAQLDGTDGTNTMRIRMTRRYLRTFGSEPGRTVTFS